jgi:hypothetical protein
MDCSDAFLDDSRQRGDPLADELVQKIFADGSVDRVNDLMRTLVHNDDLIPKALPDEVEEYLATSLLPSNVDRARIERSERFFQIWGLQISMCLFCASLPSPMRLRTVSRCCSKPHACKLTRDAACSNPANS